jgi:hypothetical protein
MPLPVRIFADHDAAGHGLAAARDLYRRLRSEGREVVLSMPDIVGEDANDVLRRWMGVERVYRVSIPITDTPFRRKFFNGLGSALMTDGVHDFTADEADPFDTLVKRAEALKNGDDVGLEALAKAAIEAKLSLPRIDKLTRAASKATKFALTAVRKVFDETRGKIERQKQAEKQAGSISPGGTSSRGPGRARS